MRGREEGKGRGRRVGQGYGREEGGAGGVGGREGVTQGHGRPGSGQCTIKTVSVSAALLSVGVVAGVLVPSTCACGHAPTAVHTAGHVVSCLCCCSGLRFVVREVPVVRLFRHGMMFPYQGPPQHMGVPGEG